MGYALIGRGLLLDSPGRQKRVRKTYDRYYSVEYDRRASLTVITLSHRRGPAAPTPLIRKVVSVLSGSVRC